MAKSRIQKEEAIAEYTSKIQGRGFVLVTHSKLGANTVNEFKKELQRMGAQFNVVKNTLFALSLKQNNLPELDSLESGTHAAVFLSDDIAGTAKVLKQFIKDNKDKVSIKVGILDGQVVTAAQIEELANLPTKEQSIAMIAGVLSNPISGLANILEDSVRSVAIIINQAFKE